MTILAKCRIKYRYIVAPIILILTSSALSYLMLSDKMLSVTRWGMSTLFISLGPITGWYFVFTKAQGVEIAKIIPGALFLIAITFLPVFLLWLQIKKGGYLYLIFASVIWLFEGWFLLVGLVY